MRLNSSILLAAAITVSAALPAFAMDSMAKGSGMMMMSNGQMMTMPTMDEKASMMMMKHPMKDCVVMMMGSDGKMYMSQMTDKACTAAAMMKK